MKIKLQSNSSQVVDLIKKNNSDIEYGYSYTTVTVNEGVAQVEGKERGIDGSWFMKMTQKLDKIFGSKDLDTDLKVTKSIISSVDFLNNQIDAEMNDGISVQVNSGSRLNKAMSSLSKQLTDLNKLFFYQIESAVDDKAAFANPSFKKIVLGVNTFKDFRLPLMRELNSRIGEEKTVEFIVLHEAAHLYEVSNIKKIGSNVDSTVGHVLVCARATISENYLDGFNQQRPKGLEPLDLNLAKEIDVLAHEIYADSMAFLLMRNKAITENKYKPESSNDLLNGLIESRRYEHNDGRNIYSNHASVFNHFSAPGLESLKESYSSIPNRILTQKEMHVFANQSTDKGIARILLSSIEGDNEVVGKLLTMLQVNVVDRKTVWRDDKTIYKKVIDDLKEVAGKEWTDNLNRKVKHIYETKPSNMDTALWYAGVDENRMKEFLSQDAIRKQSKENTQKHNNDMLATVESARTNSVALNSFDDMSFDVAEKPGKSIVLSNMLKMREDASKNKNDIGLKIKP